MSVKLQLDQLDSSNLFFNNMVPHIWNCANAGINVQLKRKTWLQRQVGPSSL
jgi:hypothetical protein